MEVLSAAISFSTVTMWRKEFISVDIKEKKSIIETFPSDVKVVCLENICYLSFIFCSVGVEHLTFFEALTI